MGVAQAGTYTNGSLVRIAINPTQTLPANDLILIEDGKPRNISPVEAWDLEKNKHVDLSLLEPDATTKLWTNAEDQNAQTQDQALPIQSGDQVTFLGTLLSSAGRLRFDGLTQSEPVKPLAFLMSRNVHTLLLRKELLRKLGYLIPAMKYLKSVKIRFPDADTRDTFLNSKVPLATNGAAVDWIVPAPAGSDPLVVELQDLIVMDAGSVTNLALAPPIDINPATKELLPEKQRILRALALPYGLANLGESINQFDWTLGLVDGDSISFNVADVANFSCSFDDALWMLRKIAKLSRADITEVVNHSVYPEPIAKLIVEKLISRRDTLVSLFHLPDSKIEFDSHLSDAPSIVNGKVFQKSWAGYVSQFAFGDQQSPLHDIHNYFISEVETNLLENLLQKANDQIPALTVESQTAAHQNDLYQAGLQHWLQTGENQAVPLGVWAAPIVSGALNLSRSVVIGNYLGTNNLVSLADSFGVTVNAGITIGVDGLVSMLRLSAGALIQGTVSINYTHLKPVKRLKQTITEPIKNEFVPWIFRHSSRIFSNIADAEHDPTLNDPEILKKAITDDLDQLKKMIDVGESLIMTESLGGIEKGTLGVGFPVPLSPEASLNAGFNQLLISRIQIYRKDADTIQVFKDNGHLNGFTLGFDVSVGSSAILPVLSITGKSYRGSSDSKVFRVKINSDLKSNPTFFGNALGLAAAIKNGSPHVLEGVSPPAHLQADFKDSSSDFRFLHLVRRRLKTQSEIEISLPDGTDDHFISLTDGKQTGSHYQKLATDAGNFIAQSLANNSNITIDTQASSNPGQSFLGQAQTRNAEFQERLDQDQLPHPYVQIQYRWQGWNKSASQTQALVDNLSDRYGFKLYPDGFLLNVKSIQLYQMNVTLNLYENAVYSIVNMSGATQDAIETKYRNRYHCFLNIGPNCAALLRFRKAMDDYHSGVTDPVENAKLMFKIVSNLEGFSDFSELVQLSGGASNLYLNSSITGFRNASEVLSLPFTSSSYGKVDPNFPTGIIDNAQTVLDISTGEFYQQWLRDIL